MTGLLKRSVVMIVRQPLLLIRAVADLVYPIIFERRDIRIAEERERQLSILVKRLFSFLFIDNAARIAPREMDVAFPPPFDYATVIVITETMTYRFIKGRGDESVHLKSIHDPGRWHELSLVLSLLDTPEGVRRGSILDFWRAAQLLRSNPGVIEEAFSDSHFKEILDKLDETYLRDHVITKQFETEINRRLYG